MALLSLPNEILFQILYSFYTLDANFNQHGSKTELLSSCLTCRKLANVGQSIIFQHITLFEDDEGFRMLFRLAQSPLRRHVRAISCYFQVNRIEDSTIDQKPCPSTFKYLVGLTDDALAGTLRRFQNLQAIRFRQRWASSWFWDLDGNESRALSANPIACRLLENLVYALPFATSHFTELTLDSDRAFCPEWPLSILSQQAHGLYQLAFGSLKRLKVVMPRIASDGVGDFGLNIRGLKAIIEASSQLEELHLSIDMTFSLEPFQLDFTIPKLRHLVLDRLLLEDLSVVLDFLEKHLGTLNSVELHRLNLVVTPPSTIDVPSTQTDTPTDLVEDSLILDRDQLQQIQRFRDEIRTCQSEIGKYDLCAKIRDDLLDQHTADFLFAAYHYVMKVECADYEKWKPRDNTPSNDE